MKKKDEIPHSIHPTKSAYLNFLEDGILKDSSS